MIKQLEISIYLLGHSEKNILIHPRNLVAPPRLELKWWPPYEFTAPEYAPREAIT